MICSLQVRGVKSTIVDNSSINNTYSTYLKMLLYLSKCS